MKIQAHTLTTQLANALDNAPRFRCAHLPTPLEPLRHLSGYLGGANLWIKRDDCTGLASGGNKARKLEFLIGDAIAQGADTLITHGAVQSNHVRQTAAAAVMANMHCEVLYEHRVDSTDHDYLRSGNVLLTQLLGANRSDYPSGTDMVAAMDTLADTLRNDGRRPYIIPGGGSNPIGAMGYANCALELAQQAEGMGLTIDHVVHATGSTGTQAGLVAGSHAMDSPFPILGIGVRLPRPEQEQKVFDLACETAEYLAIKQPLPRESVNANCDYVGDGYGIPTEGMIEAVSLLARLDGILLDPVYSGKGMAGLIDLVRKNEFSSTDNIVFLHTGGSAALFSYRSALTGEQSQP